MININTGFHLGAALPLDDRSYLTKAEMLVVNENIYPDYFLVVCADDGFLYMFDKSIDEPSAETGKFKLFAGDVDEAIRILNSTVDEEGSVLYSIFHNAATGEYETKTENVGIVDMSAFSVSNITVSEADMTKVKSGEEITIDTDFTMTYDGTYHVTQVSTSTTEDVDVTEEELKTVTTIKKAIENLADEAEVTANVFVDAGEVTEGYLKTYEILQGGKTVVRIDIPKDLVVSEGKVIEIETNETEDEFNIKGESETYTADDVVDEESDYYGYPLEASVYIRLKIANQKAPIFINAKDLLDTGTVGKVTEDITANVEVGGIAVGDVVEEGTDVTELVKRLLVKYFAPEIKLSTTESLIQRAGTTLSDVVLTATVTKKTNDVTGVTIDDEDVVDDVTEGGVFTKTIASIDATTTFGASATDGKKTTEAELTFTFVLPYMHGVSNKNSIDSDADLEALTEAVAKKGTQTFSYTANNQYALFVMPSEYADLTSILDPSSFENIDSWTKTTYTNDAGESYKVYVSNTPITCSAFKYTFK